MVLSTRKVSNKKYRDSTDYCVVNDVFILNDSSFGQFTEDGFADGDVVIRRKTK